VKIISILKLFGILLIFFQSWSISYSRQYTDLAIDTTSVTNEIKPDSAVNVEKPVKWHQMFSNIPSDYSRFFRNTFSEGAIPSLLTVGALTGALLFIDEQGWKDNNILFNKSVLDHKISDITVNIGDGKYQILAATLFAIPGLIFNDKTAIRTGSNIVEAVITTGLFVQVLKRMTGRQSPAASTENGGDWDPFPSIRQYQKNQPSFYSFPSGHLSTATAVITVIANNYPNESWIKPVGYPLLGLLSVSLVSKGMHWYSDFPLAFFLGYSFGNIIAPERESVSGDKGKTTLSVIPSITNDGIRLGFSFKF